MARTIAQSHWLSASSPKLEEFIAVVTEPTVVADVPHAARIDEGVPIYEGRSLAAANDDPGHRQLILEELSNCFLTGPGIVVITDAVEHDAIDRCSDAFFAMIADQHARGISIGDHYAKPGANDRVWNTIEKLAVEAPDVFVDYYASELIQLACEAWLGPGYQVSSQVNVVNPGGQAQMPHRDYHLGFLTDEQAYRYPGHVHHLSPVLTLQGAVAHCDMPVETGPTKYLPHSQKYEAGYVAWRRPEFVEWFERHFVQLPLRKGDAVFFNPALFHAAGTNRTSDVKRMANLLQVSSAFGRAMESIDRARMSLAIYPALLDRKRRGWSAGRLRASIAACAEGYAFPTNLDHDQPIGGLAPPAQVEVVNQALDEEWPVERFAAALAEHTAKRSSV